MTINTNSQNIAYLYHSLFFKLVAQYKLNREGFRKLIRDLYDYLPVEPQVFWENICTIPNVDFKYTDKYTFTDETILRLADSIWLASDQEISFQNRKIENLEKHLNKIQPE